MYRFLCISLIVVWFVVYGGVARAQTQPPDLTVTLHDVADAPLAGVTVIVRDSGGTHDLARASTDAQGTATFMALTESQVRVAITGTLPNGTTLYQPGNDAAGISFLLNPLPCTLALRSAADGMIVPDPAAMARELGVPVAINAAAISTARVASLVPIVQAVAPPLAAAGAPALAATVNVSTSGSSGQIWFGVAALILLIGVGIGMVVLQRRSV